MRHRRKLLAKHLEEESETRHDLTSMIDLTFLLVLFFVLTSVFVTLKVEPVLLPVALATAAQGPGLTLTINITRTGDGSRDGRIIFNGQPHDPQTLRKALDLEVRIDAARRGPELSPLPTSDASSRLEVLIRADEGVRSEYLRQVFVACQRVGIYRVEIATLKP